MLHRESQRHDGRTMKFDRNSIGVIRRLGTGSPAEELGCEEAAHSCLPMPAPMKVTYVMRSEEHRTATTDEAAMLMPG